MKLRSSNPLTLPGNPWKTICDFDIIFFIRIDVAIVTFETVNTENNAFNNSQSTALFLIMFLLLYLIPNDDFKCYAICRALPFHNNCKIKNSILRPILLCHLQFDIRYSNKLRTRPRQNERLHICVTRNQ